MLYAIISQDVENSLEKRLADRDKHRARLQGLTDEGRMVLGGPFPSADGKEGFSGSLIVAKFDSLEQAQAWADADPYVANGVYREVSVRPYKKVFP